MHGGKNWCSNYSCFVTRARNIECGNTISGKFNIAFSDKHPQVNHFLKESENEKTGDHIQKGREGGEVANLYRLRIGRKNIHLSKQNCTVPIMTTSSYSQLQCLISTALKRLFMRASRSLYPLATRFIKYFTWPTRPNSFPLLSSPAIS